MSVSERKLLASSAHSSIGSALHASSSPSAIQSSFNCLCIGNTPSTPGLDSFSVQEDHTPLSFPSASIWESSLASESVLPMHLPESVLKTSNSMASTQHHINPQSGLSECPDVSNPTVESFELFEPWDHRFSSKQTAVCALSPLASNGVNTVSLDPNSTPTAKQKPNYRTIYINDPSRTGKDNNDICGNKVRTSKYTLLNFLPKNLFEQFRRVAYIYFLAIIILNQIPQLAVFGRTASLFPLLFVLVVTAIKDGYEDWGRHRSDTIENNRLAKVYAEGEFRLKKWKRIQAGEVVKIDADTPVPCDMVLLGTSNHTGVAYIQTLNLDGESNLKTRYAIQETHVQQPDINPPVSGVVECEAPTRNIYEFSGLMRLENADVSLGPSHVILRGCEVKNTAWVIGVVVYTGKDTKVMMNSSGVRSKRSKLESQMNSATMWLAVFLLVICLIGGLGMGQWIARHEHILDSLAYYHKLDLSTGENVEFYNAAGEAIFAFLSFVIMFQVIIPISLYISMELVRLGQSALMSRDIEMYHESTGTKFECRALNINEDLGQIKYVFSDKTGTLTQNKMEFHSASVDGVNYTMSQGLNEELTQTGHSQMRPGQTAKVNSKLWKLAHSSVKSVIDDFFLVLAICNTVVPFQMDQVKHMEKEEAHLLNENACFIDYQAESPDEQALVLAAASYGYVLLERTSRSVKVAVHGTAERYELLGLHEFDSVRKRMSVVVRCPDKSIKLLLKGADAVVLNLLNMVGEDKHLNFVLSSTQEHLDLYAKEGLRTLVIASKDMSDLEHQEWEKQYRSASKELGSARVTLLRAVAESLEKNLVLLGATGVEDKLQNGVPETIAALRESGMKVWVLTGDKQETAISIGYSCNLLEREMDFIIINATTPEGCRDAFRKGFHTICRSNISAARKLSQLSNIDSLEGLWNEDGDTKSQFLSSKEKGHRQLALIIDGNSLVHALKEFEQEWISGPSVVT